MNRRFFLFGGLVVVWLLVLVLVAKVSLDRLNVPPWGNPVGGTTSLEVAGGGRVGQQFTAPWPGLYRVDVVLDRAAASGSHEVSFHLRNDPAADKDLWTGTFTTSDVQGRASHTFEFPPIRDSKGKTYYFFFTSPDSTPGDAIEVGYSPDAMLDGANAMLNGQPAAGNLQFHTIYTLRTRERVDLLLTRMAAGRPYFFGDKLFYAALAVVYVVVLGVFVGLAAKSALGYREDES